MAIPSCYESKFISPAVNLLYYNFRKYVVEV